MIARELSEESVVLLNNRHKTLPLNFSMTTKVVIGCRDNQNGTNPRTGGDGSGKVTASYVQAPVNEMAERMGV